MKYNIYDDDDDNAASCNYSDLLFTELALIKWLRCQVGTPTFHMECLGLSLSSPPDSWFPANVVHGRQQVVGTFYPHASPGLSSFFCASAGA